MKRRWYHIVILVIALAAWAVATTAAYRAMAATPPAAAHRPPSQLQDGLYKSLVVVVPARGDRTETLVCILTRLPASYPHFTIPPLYTCVRPGQ